jgi:hypothetical protein
VKIHNEVMEEDEDTSPEIPTEIQLAILAPALRHSMRALSSPLRDLHDATVTRLAIVAPPPSRETLRRRLTACEALAHLSLRDVDAVDDEIVSWLLNSRPSLLTLDLSGCRRLTPAVLVGLRSSSVSWRAEGSFSAPHPLLTPRQVVELQILALRRHDIAACFAFASPDNRAVTGPLARFTELLERYYPCMLVSLRAQACRIMTGEMSKQAIFAVSFAPPPGGGPEHDGYLWILERHLWIPENESEAESRYDHDPEAECWMTDGVHSMGRLPAGADVSYIGDATLSREESFAI